LDARKFRGKEKNGIKPEHNIAKMFLSVFSTGNTPQGTSRGAYYGRLDQP